MLFYRALFGLLILSISTTVYAESGFKRTLNPVSHTYTHEVLQDQQLKRNAWFQSGSVFQFLNACHLNFALSPRELEEIFKPMVLSGSIITPYLMLQMGVNGSIDSYDLQGIKAGFTDADAREYLWMRMKGLSTLNLVLGRLYKSPFYLRVGHDYMPFGRHFSEILLPINMVTHIVSEKGKVFEVGGSRSSGYSQWKGSLFSFRIPPILEEHSILLGGTIQYRALAYNLVRLASFRPLERYILGGGVSGLRNNKKELILSFNVYGDINYSIGSLSGISSRLEYIHNRWLFYTDCLYDALHIETSKYFRRIPFTQWRIPSAFTVGYVTCMPHEWAQSSKKVLMAYKLALWEERINLVCGGEWNIRQPEGLQPLARVSIHL